MKIGVVRETFPGERRVALVPASVNKFIESGLKVVVENNAGILAGYTDDQYREAGAELVETRASVFSLADILVPIRAAGSNPDALNSDLSLLDASHTLIGLIEPIFCLEEIQTFATSGATLFSMEMMPRITRAQSMDVLSAMATASGYQSVLIAAQRLAKFFPMLMTAAGTVTPARVLVLGAGVIGLQAIATARRLGAVVEAYDLRDVVKEQVESLGAHFVVLDIDTEETETKGGYAKAQSDAFYQKQRELLTEHVKAADVVITTALVPGRKAPILLTKDMVAAMRPGSIVIDTAAEKGGNCELTQMDIEVLTDHHVLVLGPGNLPSEVAFHTSQMYSNNITHFLQHLLNEENQLHIDLDDEITSGTLIARHGAIVHNSVTDLLAKESE